MGKQQVEKPQKYHRYINMKRFQKWENDTDSGRPQVYAWRWENLKWENHTNITGM